MDSRRAAGARTETSRRRVDSRARGRAPKQWASRAPERPAGVKAVGEKWETTAHAASPTRDQRRVRLLRPTAATRARRRARSGALAITTQILMRRIVAATRSPAAMASTPLARREMARQEMKRRAGDRLIRAVSGAEAVATGTAPLRVPRNRAE